MRIVALLMLIASLMLSSPAIAWLWGNDSELDFSSVDTMQKSVEEVTKDMSPANKEAFGRALLSILIEKNPITGEAKPGLPQLMAMGQLGDKFYDGMSDWMSEVTIDEVKAKATAMVSLEASKADAAEKAEAEKQQKAEVLLAQQKCLDERIIISNISVGKGDFSNNLTFDITNNLPFAISGFQFEYVLKQEGRSVPINKDDSSFSVSGGVEPRETKSLSYYYHGPTGEIGKTFVETRMINAFDAIELPLLNTNTTYLGRPEGFSDQKCE
ncbi:hypothetical protein [Parasulfitobacter algicola]|uniref:Uncharacterized protein n=1 Tax=Parasulfitobacter algicola TaxID=2614809 RepID=A0ABX2ISN3_9RHOB|nr:hypothetical protein [Sulfitobacter algicola]NSX54085.1 hypothetical protein [Sulfitobacter algicola]